MTALSPAPAVTIEQTSDSRRRTWFMENVLPWVTSLAIHGALLITAIIAAKVIIQSLPAIQPTEEQHGTLASDLKADFNPLGQLGPSDTVKRIPVELPGASAEGLSEIAGLSQKPEVAGGGGPGNDSTENIIAIGAGGGKGGPGMFGSGTFGPGAGGPGGPPALYGPAGGLGMAGSPVFGKISARRVVFVCDATGTMLNKFATLKNELAKAVDKLRPVQSFNIVFYSDGAKAFALDSSQLLPATEDNKRKAFKFLDDVTPSGTTDPLPAIQLAFKLQPQLVHFLSDGEFNNLRTYDEVTAEIRKSNVGNRTKVNTILFETFDQQAEDVMKRIAGDHNGTYLYIKESDLVQ